MAKLVELTVIPVASTAFLHDVLYEHKAGVATIRFDYIDVDRNDARYRSGLRIVHPKVTCRRAETFCRPEHVQGCYDTLVEVIESDWLEVIKRDIAEGWKDQWDLHHYRIYLDSAGCFEFIAESWEALPEEPGTWQ